MSRIGLVFCVCLVGACANGLAVDASPAQTAALEALAGVAAYSHKAPYSDAISDVYLGYDAAGKPCVAVALRSFKTYEKVTAMVVVREKDGAYVVDRADIPDAALIKNAEKRGKVTGAVKDITGKTVKSTTGEVSGIDAVTGATRYQARVYASFDLMARAALADLAANPEWPRTVLTPVAPAPTPDVSAQAPATGAP